jgi:hypothetical protein
MRALPCRHPPSVPRTPATPTHFRPCTTTTRFKMPSQNVEARLSPCQCVCVLSCCDSCTWDAHAMIYVRILSAGCAVWRVHESCPCINRERSFWWCRVVCVVTSDPRLSVTGIGRHGTSERILHWTIWQSQNKRAPRQSCDDLRRSGLSHFRLGLSLAQQAPSRQDPDCGPEWSRLLVCLHPVSPYRLLPVSLSPLPSFPPSLTDFWLGRLVLAHHVRSLRGGLGIRSSVQVLRAGALPERDEVQVLAWRSKTSTSSSSTCTFA